MNKREMVLAMLAVCGEDVEFSPVQVQKGLFLIDEEAEDLLGRKLFDFIPYSFGPFDHTIYLDLENLEREKLVEVRRTDKLRKFVLTPKGFEKGTAALGKLKPEAAEYLKEVAVWVRSMNFHQLVAAIYKIYPGMRKNSIFQDFEK